MSNEHTTPESSPASPLAETATDANERPGASVVAPEPPDLEEDVTSEPVAGADASSSSAAQGGAPKKRRRRGSRGGRNRKKPNRPAGQAAAVVASSSLESTDDLEETDSDGEDWD